MEENFELSYEGKRITSCSEVIKHRIYLVEWQKNSKRSTSTTGSTQVMVLEAPFLADGTWVMRVINVPGNINHLDGLSFDQRFPVRWFGIVTDVIEQAV